jgi:SAM-dependent methyltransferase
MPVARVNLPIYLPQWLYQPLRKVKHAITAPPEGADLRGDRDVEWSYIASQMPHGPGEALDFGCGGGNVSLLAAQCGFRVLALDLEPQVFFWQHESVRLIQGDLLALDVPENHFDLILNCSSVEHVGLAGRYGVTEDRRDGDLIAMQRMLSLMKLGAKMLLTIPCGKDAVFGPFHRVYGAQRLHILLSGYSIEKQTFWAKEKDNRWKLCSRDQALAFQPSADYKNVARCSYALGCFVLRKPQNAGA